MLLKLRMKYHLLVKENKTQCTCGFKCLEFFKLTFAS